MTDLTSGSMTTVVSSVVPSVVHDSIMKDDLNSSVSLFSWIDEQIKNLTVKNKNILRVFVRWFKKWISNRKSIAFVEEYLEDKRTSKLGPKSWKTSCPDKRLWDEMLEFESKPGFLPTLPTSENPTPFLNSFPCDCREKFDRCKYTIFQDAEDLCMYFLKLEVGGLQLVQILDVIVVMQNHTNILSMQIVRLCA